MFSRAAVSFIFLTFFIGCAHLHAGHEINLDPPLDLEPSDEGEDRSVAVRVVDERPAERIGFRSHEGAAEITSTREVRSVIHSKVVEGLRMKGFQTKREGADADAKVTVTVKELAYVRDEGGSVRVSAELHTAAEKETGQYEGSYGASREEHVGIQPSARQNEEWINAVLSRTLKRMFDDEGLVAFLKD